MICSVAFLQRQHSIGLLAHCPDQIYNTDLAERNSYGSIPYVDDSAGGSAVRFGGAAHFATTPHFVIYQVGPPNPASVPPTDIDGNNIKNIPLPKSSLTRSQQSRQSRRLGVAMRERATHVAYPSRK